VVATIIAIASGQWTRPASAKIAVEIDASANEVAV
jgi:hypothetical protein